MKRSLKLIIAGFLAAVVVGSICFLKTRMWQRWDIDPNWASVIIVDAQEIRERLDDYRTSNGEFPLTLEAIEVSYEQPTDFYDRGSEGRWNYRRITGTEYQLFVTGTSFVSSFDAMVFRSSGNYPEQWFHKLDSFHSKQFGDWQYITGFSSFERDP